ncbi:hypothetical protein AAVH_15137 [Aphelenchoides avenae]|nr:hypothetical protein AAVH_15137 [Aphelenchus avenae]
MLPETGLPLGCVYDVAKFASGRTIEAVQATCDEVFGLIGKRLRVMPYENVTTIDAYIQWRQEQFQVAPDSEKLRLHMLNRKIRVRYNAHEIRDLRVKFFRVCPQCPERNMIVGFTKALREHRTLPFNDNIVGVILTGAEACDFSKEVQ